MKPKQPGSIRALHGNFANRTEIIFVRRGDRRFVRALRMLITSSKQMWSKGGVAGAAAGPGRRWGYCAAVPQSLTHDEFVAHHKQARAKLFMSIPVVRETVRRSWKPPDGSVERLLADRRGLYPIRRDVERR